MTGLNLVNNVTSGMLYDMGNPTGFVSIVH